MKSITLLALILGVASSSTELPSQETNSSEPVAVFTLNFGSLVPFFGPPNLYDDKVNMFNDAIDPREPVANASQDTSDNVVVIHFSEVISFSDDNQEPSQDSDSQLLSIEKFLLRTFGILNLSWRNLTGPELKKLLSQNPGVTTLILSNARISGLNADTFSPVQDTLRELKMDNCTASLNSLSYMSNLRFLNLSHNGLSTFEWFPQLSDTLEVLDLSFNQYTEILPELSVLTNLRELYLQNNRINTVEENPLSQLVNLEVLSLSMNVLTKVSLTNLNNLQEVDLDWNYLRLFGSDVQLPVHRAAVKLASNPWRCDCGILEARDAYDVLDLDSLECPNEQSYSYCVDCKRYFLPEQNGRLVGNLTKDSIEHLGCTGIRDQYYLLRQALIDMRDHDPEKLVNLALLIVTGVLLMVAAILICKKSCSKNNKQNWLKIQKIPQLSFDKLTKPQQVPYIIIDETDTSYKA